MQELKRPYIKSLARILQGDKTNNEADWAVNFVRTINKKSDMLTCNNGTKVATFQYAR